MFAHKKFPYSSYVCPYDMGLVALMFLLQSHIHVYSLICVVHKQMLECQFVRSVHVLYVSQLWLSMAAIYALLHVLHFSLYIPLGFLWAGFSVICWCIVFLARKAMFKLVCLKRFVTLLISGLCKWRLPTFVLLYCCDVVVFYLLFISFSWDHV
jgi:hypothetical protein